MSYSSNTVRPLGVFGRYPSFELVRSELLGLAGMVPQDERLTIAKYLRGGAIVFAIMEYTRDVVEDTFGVSGGSSVLTDGTYYWRRDAADYVEHHGIALPEDFLHHGRSLGWVAPRLTADDVLGIDQYLYNHVRRSVGT